MVGKSDYAESRSEDGSVIYILGAPGGNTVKIGTTRHLSKRLGEIQRMSPVPLAILWTHPGGHELEANLHRHFKDVRSHGEWFVFRRNPVQLVQWAVEDQPWLRPKVKLAKPRRASTAPAPPTPRDVPPSAEEERALAALALFAATLESNLGAVSDPVEKYRAAVKAEATKDVIMKAVWRELALTLKGRDLTWREVGEIMGGVSAQRAHQISKYPPLQS